MESGDIQNRFAFHPADPAKGEVHSAIRDSCLVAAVELNTLVPFECREKSLMITALEEAMFWGNAAVARHDVEGKRL
jgi:hypothetical protein